MAIIAKMVVDHVINRGTQHLHDSYAGESRPMPAVDVVLRAVTGKGPDEMPENEVFNKSTPVGRLELSIRNALASEQLQPGDEWYVRLEKVPQPATVV